MFPAATIDNRLPAASWRVLALLAFSVFINYVDRGNLSIAAPLLKIELHLSASQLGLLLSAFFWTYSVFQLPAGWLIDRFGVTWVLACGFFLWSVATGVTGLLHGFAALLAIRLVLGIGEAVAYPACSNILARHFPEHHRGIANATIASGQASGPAFATFVGGMLMSRFGWRPFFIVLGLTSLLWLIPWFRWSPRTQFSFSKNRPLSSISITQVMKQPSVWGTCIGLFSANYLLYLLLTWLPFYLVHERHVSLASTAKIGGAVFLLIASSALATGKISDVWILSGATPTLVRKTFLCTGITLAGILRVLSALVPSNFGLIVLLLAAAVSLGMATPQYFAVSQTLAGPHLAGTWTGLQNFVGNLAGIVGPAVTGFIVDRSGQFLWAFIVTAMVGWTGTLSWLFVVGPIQQVIWIPKESIERCHDLAL
jgi:ACS family D-galactonate transporter-like MFS transporter